MPAYAKVIHFVNADLIAAGLSPLRPEMGAIAAGRLVLREIDRLAGSRSDFAFESALGGLAYVARLNKWKRVGYRIEIIYLKLPNPGIGLDRVAARVRQGGHDVPPSDLARRFERSWKNFETIYRPLADSWWVYDNSGDRPRLVDEGP